MRSASSALNLVTDDLMRFANPAGYAVDLEALHQYLDEIADAAMLIGEWQPANDPIVIECDHEGAS
jgi:hypothetical protein